MKTNHIVSFNENIKAINRLLEIHEELTGTKPGYRDNVEVLNKSGVIMLVACWEAFVEDLAEESFDFMLNNATDHNVFPNKVLTRSSRSFWEGKNELKVWDLAGTGWKSVLTDNREKTLKYYVGDFNTPRAPQIDSMFENLLGMSNLSSHWKWQKMTANQATDKLSDLITIRGDIAHRVTTSESVKKAAVWQNGIFINRLAVVSSNTLRDYVEERTGKYPWNKIVIPS